MFLRSVQKLMMIAVVMLLFGFAHAFCILKPTRLNKDQIAQKMTNFKAVMHFAVEDITAAISWEICFEYEQSKTSLTYKQILDNYVHVQIAQPFVAPNNCPQLMSVNKLAHFLKDKRVLLYTGAGISAGIVPTMPEILNNLGLIKHSKESFFDIFKNKSHSEKLTNYMHTFFCACVNGIPSAAHYAIAQMAFEHEWPVVTENLDLLHEKTGLDVIKRGQNGNLFTNSEITSPEFHNQIDVILCLGLSTDESSLLNTFRQQNAKGVIVAINLLLPEYLSSRDVFLAGDVQCLVPQLLHDLQNIN